jgi:SNF2 family DNA or RNA helicase
MPEAKDPRDHLDFNWDLDFEVAERELGRDLYQAGGVEIGSLGDVSIEAHVKHFDRRVEVIIDLENGEVIGHDCDCPHFEETQQGCEHRWALLLALAAAAQDDEDEPEVIGGRPRPVWLLNGPESERRGKLVVNAVGDDGHPLRLDLDAWTDLEDSRDVEAWRAIAPHAGGFSNVGGHLSRDGGGLRRPLGPWEIKGEDAGALVRTLLETKRMRLAYLRSGSVVVEKAREGDPLDLVLRPRRRADGKLELGAFAESPKGRRVRSDISSVSLLTPGREPWVVIDDTLHSLRAFGAEDWARSLRRASAPPVSRARYRGMMERLAADQELPRLAMTPDRSAWPVEAGEAKARASLRERGGDLIIDLTFHYGTDLRVMSASRADLAHDFVLECSFMRDQRTEDRARQALLSLEAEADVEDPTRFLLPRADTEAIALTLLDEGLEVHLENRPLRRGKAKPARLESEQDWFRIAGGIEVEGEARPLGTLLDAMNARAKGPLELEDEFIVLDPQSRLDLEALAPLGALRRRDDDDLVLDAGQALLADALLDPSIPRDPAFAAARERLSDARPNEPVAIPEGLLAELRPYQEEGLRWLAFLDEIGLAGCLADDMGLGKTVQSIAWLLHRRPQASAPFLLVLPRSLVGNWGDELARFAPEIPVHHYDGPRRKIDRAGPGEILITTYGILRRDAAKLAGHHFDAVVLDEAQAIKNADSATAKAARGLEADRRLALSGTPIENDLSELWSLFEFLDPGLLGRRRDFLNAWRRAEPSDLIALRQGLAPLMLRRRKEEVAPELPPLIEQTIICDMSPKQARVYAELRDAARAELLSDDGPSKGTTRVLEALLRLRQVACDPRLVGRDDTGSGKMDLLMERLGEARARGDKVIIFSQFTKLLDLVQASLEERSDEVLRLDGSTRDRDTPVRTFQDREDPMVFLISLKAGGTGLNLTAADLVFVLDPWWNPAAEAQAIARAHRIGRKGSVLAQRLVTRDSVEEQILDLQARKRALADALLGEDAASLERMKLEDLEMLLSGS